MIYLETISPRMHEVARVIYEKLDSSYYLAGGTGLALLINHRESIDFDFFTPASIDTQKLKDELSVLFPDITFTYEEKDTLWCEVDDIKLSFITRRAICIDSFREEDGFRIASLRDILAMKLNAVCGREEYKDYYDLALLLDQVPGSEWLDLWKKVYPQSDPVSWMVALAYVPQVAEVSLRGTSIQSKKSIEEKLLQFVKGL